MTTSGRYHRAKELFVEALEQPADQRVRFVEKSCGDDHGFKNDMLGLLADHESGRGIPVAVSGTIVADALREVGVALDSATAADAVSPTEPERPERVGPYRILSILGEGGMGTVYLAEQTKPVRRRVALKLIKLGMDTRDVIARFESEQQALALMNHPNVACVLDVDTTEQGQPYFVMEHVPGEPITTYCDKRQLALPERLDLFMQVCHAIQHAHQKGVIHRDIKPSNVLVMHQDGKSVPKVIDFGVAKATDQRLTEKTVFTEPGRLIGTPAYMSPEQAQMTTLDIDTRTDVYSLGALLYELLTSTLPFDPKSLRSADVAAMQRIIREVEPSKPSTKFSNLLASDAESGSQAAQKRRLDARTLIRRLRGDLDWVTMKALEKDRTRRYDSASSFAADIQRHLRSEPVVAGPPSVGYRVSKFVRRNRVGVIAASAVLVVLLTGIVGTTWGLLAAVDARDAEREAKEQTQTALKLAEAREQEVSRQARIVFDAREELKQVTEFQASMLGGIDLEQMGHGIFSGVRDGIRKALEAGKSSEEDIEKALASISAWLAGLNATDLALMVVDQHVLSRAVETIEQDFADQPLVRASLQHAVASTYYEIGLHEPALPLLEGSLAIRRRALGDAHPDTLTSISWMGSLLQSMGKLAEAEPHYREALEGRRNVLGNDHPDTLISISNVGALLLSMGKYEAAEPHYREALESRRNLLGNNHADTLISISRMGALLQSMGKLAEAEPLYREALEGRRNVLGNDHADTLTSINNMGTLLQLMGKLTEAEPYFREALEGFRHVLGDDHPHTLISSGNVGALLQSMGKYEAAEPYCREALETSRRVLGNDHPDTLTSMNNMGILLGKLGRSSEAEPYYREAIEASRRVLGDDHPNTLTSINNIGALLRKLGRPSEAEPYCREAMEGLRHVLGDDHPTTLTSMSSVGSVLNALGKHEDALEVLHAGESAARRAWTGPNTRWLGNYLARLGEAEGATNRFAEGEATLLEAHRLLAEGFGVDHASTTACIERLVTLYESWHATELDKVYDAKAAEWRAKLAAVGQQSEPPQERTEEKPTP